jgi:ERCC4-related helicase
VGFRELTGLKRHYAGQAGQLVNTFYVPVLREAVRYDRQAGYFDSGALVQLASGLAGFIQHVRESTSLELTGPRMRLITGATWSPDDIQAYRRGEDALTASLGTSLLQHLHPNDEECARLGLPPGWTPEEDQIARNRLGTLAWLVAGGLLEVRVALPLDDAGNPYLPGRQGALYHPKAGVLADSDGNLVSFQGSVNETGAAWVRNREKFEVKRSWYSEQDREDIEMEIEEFETIWSGLDPGLLVLGLPKAVRDHLRAFLPPDGPPPRDPMEIDLTRSVSSARDRIIAQWFLGAPGRQGGEALVLSPLNLRAFPHQQRIAKRTVDEYPRSFLFCDEVGLGKTIEAGLSLRTLLLKGDLRRVLILAPRSLVRQWMEELREKFALTAWFFDGEVLRDVAGRERRADRPWDEDGILLVSRHLAARSDRREAVLGVSRPWDTVIVDEAHAARRQVFRDNKANQALSLLQDLRARQLYRSLWLLTATPMQLEAHEVHDLLLLCGVDAPAWAEWRTAPGFSRFFSHLREFPTDRDVREPVISMTRISVERGAPDLDARQVPADWTPFQWNAFLRRVRQEQPGLSMELRGLTAQRADAMTPYLARQSPLAVHMFRHTRATLRAYQEHGVVAGLARRRPDDIPVAFRTEQERELYERIDNLCAEFYRLSELAPEERSGVGFLMAVFRKRLSSSFFAFRRSLERRRDLIATVQQQLVRTDAETAVRQQAVEDAEGDDLDADAGEWDGLSATDLSDRERARLVRLFGDPRRRQALDRERQYIQTYIGDLAQISADSKFDAFAAKLDAVLHQGQRVIVFTQYLDTLDFIRSQLEYRFGTRMACYSGRGGEVWDPGLNTWRTVEKAEIKARARASNPRAIEVLLGTDAASEGLNLQEFSAVINYDLPWNPMRVEQRIGRIDRIGQAAPEVTILNLYVRDTIEQDTYETLKERIHAFEEVVGPLQPILAEMPRIFRKVAQGDIELQEARRLLDEAARMRPSVPIGALEECVVPDRPMAVPQSTAPTTQDQLANWCLLHPAPGMRVLGVPEPGRASAAQLGSQGCLSLVWALAPAHVGITSTEEVLVTFSAELADRHPPTAPGEAEDGTRVPGREGVRLLTWGDPLLAAWLEAIRGEPLSDETYHLAGLRPDVDPFGDDARPRNGRTHVANQNFQY